jgi:glyoxylase-like metal-dependent hydrolase (beta-lactamase superfamily II)
VLRILRVLAPNPGPYTLEGTNTWIVGLDPAVVIDPGPEQQGHLDAVASEAGRVGAVLVTHRHPDHARGAAGLAQAIGAPLLAFPVRAGPDDLSIQAEPLADGREIEVGGGRLLTVHTPGHTPDHVSFLAPGAGALFTGDTVLGRGTSVIDPAEGDLAVYLRSLRRLRDLRPRAIYPGHGPAVFDGVGKLDEYLRHRAQRETQVLEVLRRGPRTAAEIVPEVYGTYPTELLPAAARSVLAHMVKLEREGRVVRAGGVGDDASFALLELHDCERCGRPAMPRSRLCQRCTVDLLQESPTPEVAPPEGPTPLGLGQGEQGPEVRNDVAPPTQPDEALGDE